MKHISAKAELKEFVTVGKVFVTENIQIRLSKMGSLWLWLVYYVAEEEEPWQHGHNWTSLKLN